MLFRFLLLLSLIGALTVFTVQNLTLTPLVFLGISLPALPLSLWVLGAIAAGAVSIWVIQGLYQLTAFVNASESPASGRSPKRQAAATTTDRNSESRQRSRWESPLRRDRPSSPDPDSFEDRDPAPRWQDRRRESATTVPPSRSRPPVSGDDWERPITRDWDGTATVHSPPSASRDRTPTDSPPDSGNVERDFPPTPEYPPDPYPQDSDSPDPDPPTSYSPDPYPSDPYPSDRWSDRRSPQPDPPQRETPRRSERYDDAPSQPRRDRSARSNPADQVVDADYRVIVPPYTPLSELIKETPPPPEPEENADDWFDDSPDDFEPNPKQ